MNPTKRRATGRVNLPVEKWYLALKLGLVRVNKENKVKGVQKGLDRSRGVGK